MPATGARSGNPCVDGRLHDQQYTVSGSTSSPPTSATFHEAGTAPYGATPAAGDALGSPFTAEQSDVIGLSPSDGSGPPDLSPEIPLDGDAPANHDGFQVFRSTTGETNSGGLTQSD